MAETATLIFINRFHTYMANILSFAFSLQIECHNELFYTFIHGTLNVYWYISHHVSKLSNYFDCVFSTVDTTGRHSR